MLLVYSTKPISAAAQRPKQSGFILISSLSILSLLLLIALASVQLSSIETRRSRQDREQVIAKANAKLALQIALSQLQLHTGRDQTTTCRADLLDTRLQPTSKADPAILHPHYTLAFQSSPCDGDYNHALYGRGVFLRSPRSLPACLVSGNEGFDLLGGSPSEAYPENYTTPSTPLDPLKSVTLLAGKGGTRPVRAPVVTIKGHKSQAGGYAYWIADENLKARINLGAKDSTHPPTPEEQQTATFNQLRASATLGTSAAGHDHTAGFLTDIQTPEKCLTPLSVGVYGKSHTAAIREHLHDFTTYSESVLCDLQHGGLKKNLTAAVNLNAAHFAALTDHTGDEKKHPSPVFLYKGWSFPAETEDLSYSHYPGAPWELFRSYIRRPEFEPTLAGQRPLALSHLGSKAHTLANYWQQKPQGRAYTHPLDARLVRRSPVLLRFQLGIDYSVGYLGKVVDAELGGECHEFELRQHFTPTISFWNPYNADIDITEAIEYHLYLDRNWTTGRNNTQLKLRFPSSAQWKYFGLHQDQKKEKPTWSAPLTTSPDLYYPYHPSGNDQSGSVLARSSFHVPPFQLEAGKTALFSVGSSNKLMRFKKSQKNVLERLESSTQSGHSFYSKNAKIRIAADAFPDFKDAIPEVEILAFPSNAGAERTRLHVTNGSSFQRINWNFSRITSDAAIRFIPTLLSPADPLPQSDSNGTESPKFSAVVIRKFADIQHYTPEGEIWKTPSNSIDSNAYLAPWSLFYQDNASRYAAYGSDPSGTDTFSSPPQYLTGIILGSHPILQPDLTPSAESFVGYSDRASSGSSSAIQIALPRDEIRNFSPAHLSQINTAKWLSNYNAEQSNASATDALNATNALGNSFCSPHIPPSASSVSLHDQHAYASSATATQYDTSFRYNQALWDRYFFTGERAGEITTRDGITNTLPARHLIAQSGMDLATFQHPHRSASKLMLEGGFNVNSTSVEAWKVLLATTLGKHTTDENTTPFPRLQYAGSSAYSKPPTDATLPSYYDGSQHRALTTNELHTLAQHIVTQNKLRGPYTTLSQFINRSLSPEHHFRKSSQNLPLSHDDVSYEGAIQSAINATEINGAFNITSAQFPPDLVADPQSTADFAAGKINPKCLKYHSGYGTPGTLTQADILSRIGHRLTARSDTFTIRTYGEARDSQGNITATAYCEAVVQRGTSYINAADPPETPPQQWQLDSATALPINGKWTPNPQLSPLSKKLGRRYQITQFRWLQAQEFESH